MAGDPLGSTMNGRRLPLSPWMPPPTHCALILGQAELWRFRLDLEDVAIVGLKRLLNGAELQRAARLRDPRKGDQFVVARSRLRQILACYLETDPQELEFKYNPHGKPFVAQASAAHLEFNLAHAGCWGALLVCGSGAVGVDLETLDRTLEADKVVAHYFSDAERSAWQHYPRTRQTRGFFRLWTRKEALLKAAGGGFAVPLPAGSWQLRSFALGRGYLGAMALHAGVVRIQRWHLA